MCGIRFDTDIDPDDQVTSTDAERHDQLVGDITRDTSGRLGRNRASGQRDVQDEFIATLSDDQTVRGDARRHALGDGAQQQVAGIMAQRFVDGPETLDLEHDQRTCRRQGVAQHRMQGFVQTQVLRQTSQTIVMGEMTQLGLNVPPSRGFNAEIFDLVCKIAGLLSHISRQSVTHQQQWQEGQ
jgi:hypothetical protein